MTDVSPQPPGTRELIERFHVCWDVWPEYAFINHEKRQIGFELDLSGRHEDGPQHPEPGCEKCRETYCRAVLRIGCSGRTAQTRPEVVLRIRIMHREAFEQPVDAAQFRYLENLRQRLEDWGIGQR